MIFMYGAATFSLASLFYSLSLLILRAVLCFKLHEHCPSPKHCLEPVHTFCALSVLTFVFASSQNEAVCFLFFVFKKFFKQNVALPVTEGVQSSCSTCFCSWCPSMEGPATVANILP